MSGVGEPTGSGALTPEEWLTLMNEGEPVDLTAVELCVVLDPQANGWLVTRGEILVVDKDSGREVLGEGRKPSKWDVACVYVDTLAEAREIVARLDVGDDPDAIRDAWWEQKYGSAVTG